MCMRKLGRDRINGGINFKSCCGLIWTLLILSCRETTILPKSVSVPPPAAVPYFTFSKCQAQFILREIIATLTEQKELWICMLRTSLHKTPPLHPAHFASFVTFIYLKNAPHTSSCTTYPLLQVHRNVAQRLQVHL